MNYMKYKVKGIALEETHLTGFCGKSSEPTSSLRGKTTQETFSWTESAGILSGGNR